LTKIHRLFLISVLTVAVLLLLRGSAHDLVKAQASQDHKCFFPYIFKPETVHLDDFADQDPQWSMLNMQPTASDTFCRHERRLFYCEIRDNADRYVMYPGWRPLGDFKLEVNARFDRPYRRDPPAFQTRNGLGLIFGASDDWRQQYAYMLGYWGEQHAWAFLRYDGQTAEGKDIKTALSPYGGAPNYVYGYDSWNHLMIIRRGDMIILYCNGIRMPMPPPHYTYIMDGTYGTNRLIGLTITSWEASFEKIEFDNFKYTPLSMPY